MTDKELRKLSRKELLEMLVLQTRKNEEQKRTILSLEAQLQDKQLTLANAGSMAEAVLQLNGVFEAAKAASEQYTENVRRMEKDAERILQDARQEADEIIKQAHVKANAIVSQAHSTADAIRERKGEALWKKA